MKSLVLMFVVLCVVSTVVVSAPGGSYGGTASIGKGSSVKTTDDQATVGTGSDVQASSGKGSNGRGSNGKGSGGRGSNGQGSGGQGAGGQGSGGQASKVGGIYRKGDSYAKGSNRVAITGSDNNVAAKNTNNLDSHFWTDDYKWTK